MEWPSGIDPWTSAVTPRDTGIHRGGHCVICQALLGEQHHLVRGERCRIMGSRLISRHWTIARLHLMGRQAGRDHAEAIRLLANRDALIDDLRHHGLLDRTLFLDGVRGQRDDIDSAFREIQRYRHLDAGWDGKGWRPSSTAAIRAAALAAFGG